MPARGDPWLQIQSFKLDRNECGGAASGSQLSASLSKRVGEPRPCASLDAANFLDAEDAALRYWLGSKPKGHDGGEFSLKENFAVEGRAKKD